MSTLREIRERNFISRKTLGDLAGVSESTIERMEEGKGRTTEEVIEKVLEALGNKIGEKLTTANVEGIKDYNIMRDRKQRRKSEVSSPN